LTWPSATSRAHTTTTSAKVPLPIHFFWPLITHSSPSRRAEVSSATESEPWSGSVSANAPSFPSRAISGNQRCFCSSAPSTLTLANAGLQVEVLEAADTPGGGTRSSELTLPGLIHDECSGFHPLAWTPRSHASSIWPGTG
jgi:hypothetical protein